MDALTSLMLFAQDGDREAFADVVRSSSADVARFVEHIAPGADIDDIVQDTYIRLWRALPSFRHDSKGVTFLFGIARRAAIDELRRMQRRRRIAAHVHVVDTHSDLGEAHALDALVQALGAERREAFVFTQILGLSYEETAEIVGVPVGTIRSRVARARDELAEAYRGHASPRGS